MPKNKELETRKSNRPSKFPSDLQNYIYPDPRGKRAPAAAKRASNAQATNTLAKPTNTNAQNIETPYPDSPQLPDVEFDDEAVENNSTGSAHDPFNDDVGKPHSGDEADDEEAMLTSLYTQDHAQSSNLQAETQFTLTDGPKRGRTTPNFTFSETTHFLNMMEKYLPAAKSDYDVIAFQMEQAKFPKRSPEAYYKRFNNIKKGLTTGGGSHNWIIQARKISEKISQSHGTQLINKSHFENPLDVENARINDTVGVVDPTRKERSTTVLENNSAALSNYSHTISASDVEDSGSSRGVKRKRNAEPDTNSFAWMYMQNSNRFMEMQLRIQQDQAEKERRDRLEREEREKREREEREERRRHDREELILLMQNFNGSKNTTIQEEQRLRALENTVQKMQTSIDRLLSVLDNKESTLNLNK